MADNVLQGQVAVASCNEHGSALTCESLTHPEEATQTECTSVLSPYLDK